MEATLSPRADLHGRKPEVVSQGVLCLGAGYLQRWPVNDKRETERGNSKMKSTPVISAEPSFNLLGEPWIPVLWRGGRAERVGIKTALTNAGKIRQIAATNPMDNVALLRFLLAVLLWCKAEAKEALGRLMDADPKVLGIPEDWLGSLTEHEGKFDLFDCNYPFMQDVGVQDSKANAATELVHDIPSGSALNHFLHSNDFKAGLCPACCALGLVRWPCYATAGTKGAGQSMTASPNGNTPAYSLDVCDSLLVCLQASLNRIVGTPSDVPIWDSSKVPNSLGPLSGLTWRSRRVVLSVPSDNDGKPCAYCGAREGGLVREIRFQPGWKRLSDKPWEDDPHLVRVKRQRKKGEPEKVLIAHPSPNDPIDRAAVLWRDLSQGVVERLGTNPPNRAEFNVVVLGSNQALLKHVETIRVRPGAGSDMKQVGLTKDVLGRLRATVKASTPNEKTGKDDHPEINAAAALLTPEAEKQVQTVVADLPPASQPDTQSVKMLLRNIYQPVVEQVVDATAKGSPLRRRIAKDRARGDLNQRINEIVNEAHKPASAGEGGATQTRAEKPKGTGKKGGKR